MAARAPSIPTLTGVRPFASLLVFCFHFCRPVVAGGPPWLKSLFGAGFVAVSFFFVLSGFILAVSHRERLRTGALDGRLFLVRRISRIYPAYLCALALMLPLALWAPWGTTTGAFPDPSPAPKLASGVLHLFMLQAWWPPRTLTWNLPAWSVSVELGCYVAFLLLAPSLARLSRRATVGLAGALWALGLGITLVYSRFAPEAALAGPDASAPLLDLIKLWPPSRMPEFFFGVTLGLVWRPELRAPAWLGPAAVVAIFAALTHAPAFPYALLHNALLLPAFGALLWSLAGARGPVARVLGSRPFVAVGKATYSLYILQMPLMYWLLLAMNRAGVSLGGFAFLAVFVPLVLATTAAVHLAIERPGRRALGQWLEAITEQLGKRRAAALGAVRR
jgi:peptidoglycan/LPS O-acetylase OafA/YrhL